MEFDEAELALIERFLSTERLAQYVVQAGSQQAAIALHQHVLMVGASLTPIVALIEIAVRNEISHHLSSQFGANDWLLNSPAGFRWKSEEADKIGLAISSAQRAAYSKMTNAQKASLDVLAYPNGLPPLISHGTRTKKRQKQIQVTAGQVTAQLTLYFWKRLFSTDYDGILWNRSLKKVFPNKKLKRSDVAQHLENLYQSRNRLAHHEPIVGLRLKQTLEAIQFVAQNFQSVRPSPNTPLSKLLEPHRQSMTERINEMLAAFNNLRAAQDIPNLDPDNVV